MNALFCRGGGCTVGSVGRSYTSLRVLLLKVCRGAMCRWIGVKLTSFSKEWMPMKGDKQATVFYVSIVFIEHFVERLGTDEAVDRHSNRLVNIVGTVRVGIATNFLGHFKTPYCGSGAEDPMSFHL
jgi:hypothetical protein